jgi:hypothetical protein
MRRRKRRRSRRRRRRRSWRMSHVKRFIEVPIATEKFLNLHLSSPKLGHLSSPKLGNGADQDSSGFIRFFASVTPFVSPPSSFL